MFEVYDVSTVSNVYGLAHPGSEHFLLRMRDINIQAAKSSLTLGRIVARLTQSDVCPIKDSLNLNYIFNKINALQFSFFSFFKQKT